jgi:hypothetical protein
MEGARIIQLVDPVETGGAVTFEEAFGEQSELRGRGRARRQERRQTRKMTRINNRTTRKAAKQEARQTRKATRVENRVNRKSMKGQAQREQALADAENEQAVEALQPQEEEANYAPQEEVGYSQQSEDSGYEEAPEELDQDSYAEDEESEFEAGSTSDYASSFDSESSDASGRKPEKTLAQRIEWNKKMIDVYSPKLALLKESLKSGKLPSNKVAETAKKIKKIEFRVNEATARLNHLMKQESGFNGRRRVPMTNVKRSLNATIEPNRIEVPANSSADGDVFNCADGDDFSGFDAKEAIKKNKNVLIGVGVAAVVIVGLHFAGVFKK